MKRLIPVFLLTALITGCANMHEWLGTSSDIASAAGYNNQSQLVSAVKQTLEISSTRASSGLSQSGAYLNNPALKIMLPEQFNTLTNTMRQFGMGRYVDSMEKSMNQGAEQAAAVAGDMFIKAVKNMDVSDALGIIRGGNTAATDYFRSETENQLRQEYQPIIRKNLEQVGFYDEYRRLLDVYNTLPLSKSVNLDLEDYVVEQSLNGLFSRVAEEEQNIRANPLGRGSELIGNIFNANK